MTKKELNGIIAKAAAAHGFETSEGTGVMGLTEIRSENLNFTFQPKTSKDTDWEKGIYKINLAITASVSRMGGSPSPQELLQTAEEIKRGAELTAELQSMNLSWIEE